MYASYTPNLYTSAASAVTNPQQQAYYPAVMGSASGGDCPQGSLNNKWQQGAGNIPNGVCRSPEIPVVNNRASNPTNPPFPDLANVGGQAFSDMVSENKVVGFELECCPHPGHCENEIFWRASYKGCPTTYIDETVGYKQVEVAPLGDRYWLGDLDSLKYERSIMNAAEPNPYQYMNSRQMLMQFLMKDLTNLTDPQTRPIVSLDDSFSAKFLSGGPPKFTVF